MALDLPLQSPSYHDGNLELFLNEEFGTKLPKSTNQSTKIFQIFQIKICDRCVDDISSNVKLLKYRYLFCIILSSKSRRSLLLEEEMWFYQP